MSSVLTVPNGACKVQEQLSVTKTDPNGQITYANERFCQVSGYTEKELLGRPHSLCRHPDMPRGIFSLAWERLQAGHEIFVIVQNLTKSGTSYWVLAHMTPTFDSDHRIVGFHSSRRAVREQARAAMSRLYEEMLQRERGEAKATAVRRSREYLDEFLHKAEKSYDAYIFSLLREGKQHD